MDAQERAAVATVVAASVSEVNTTVEQVSGVIRRWVGRSLRPLGLAGELPMTAVNLGHSGVHASIQGVAGLTGVVASEVLARTTPDDAQSLFEDSDWIARAAALGAAFGDRLPTALAPSLWWHVLAPEEGVSDRMAVFVHGLGGHEQQWDEGYFATALAAGFTVVSVRYNTGQAIADSAAEFADLMASLVAAAPLERIVIVGHSMGGLVATEALNLGQPWVSRVSDLVTLGTPHKGAPLERVSDAMLKLLARSEVAAPIADLGHRRSQGIKDLAYGVLDSAPGSVRHHAVVAYLGDDDRHPLTVLFGDGLVPPASAEGRERDGERTVTVLSRVGHNTLLRHPEVNDLLAGVFGMDNE